MDARSKIINREIALHASTMGKYHGDSFSEKCGNAMMHATMLSNTSEDEIATSVAILAAKYMDDVTSERNRILEIDALAAQLPPGSEAMVRAAKFETLVTAGELATQVITSHKTALEMPRRAQ